MATDRKRPRLTVYLSDDIKDWWEETAKRMGCKPSTFVAQLLTSIASADLTPLELLAACAPRNGPGAVSVVPLHVRGRSPELTGNLVPSAVRGPTTEQERQALSTSTGSLQCVSAGERRGGDRSTPGAVPLPPWEEPESSEPDTLWGGLGQELLKVYPHGWSDDGVKRIPSPVDVDMALGPLIRDGIPPGEILAGARRLAEFTPGAQAQYNRGLLRWLAGNGWAARLERTADSESYESRMKKRDQASKEADETMRELGANPLRMSFSYDEDEDTGGQSDSRANMVNTKGDSNG